jgi:hypothetical protein
VIPNLKAEVLAPVINKEFPGEEDFKALDNLASTIAKNIKSMACLRFHEVLDIS